MADEKPTEAGGNGVPGLPVSDEEFFWLAFQMFSIATSARRVKSGLKAGTHEGFRECALLHANFVLAWTGKITEPAGRVEAVAELFARCHKLLSS